MASASLEHSMSQAKGITLYGIAASVGYMLSGVHLRLYLNYAA